jgi:hypothetical protein
MIESGNARASAGSCAQADFNPAKRRNTTERRSTVTKTTTEKVADKVEKRLTAGPSTKEEIRAAFQEMVGNGELVPTGEMRPRSDTGALEPVFVLAEDVDDETSHLEDEDAS